MVELRTFNPWVVGSSPTWCTKSLLVGFSSFSPIDGDNLFQKGKNMNIPKSPNYPVGHGAVEFDMDKEVEVITEGIVRAIQEQRYQYFYCCKNMEDYTGLSFRAVHAAIEKVAAYGWVHDESEHGGYVRVVIFGKAG